MINTISGNSTSYSLVMEVQVYKCKMLADKVHVSEYKIWTFTFGLLLRFKS